MSVTYSYIGDDKLFEDTEVTMLWSSNIQTSNEASSCVIFVASNLHVTKQLRNSLECDTGAHRVQYM